MSASIFQIAEDGSAFQVSDSITFNLDPLVCFTRPVQSGSTYSTFRDFEGDRAIEFEGALSERIITSGKMPFTNICIYKKTYS